VSAGRRARPGHLGRLVPVVLLLLGAVGREVLQPAGEEKLRRPLASLPASIADLQATADHPLSDAELTVLNPQDYLLRSYRQPGGGEVTVFIAYYGRQTRGASIHSPRNCLPGAGWEPIRHERVPLRTAYGDGSVNRYVIEHKSGRKALVFYWYQGRGRIESSEYLVKWQMLRDALVKRRTDEALVRVVLPIEDLGAASRLRVRTRLRDVVDALRARLPAS